MTQLPGPPARRGADGDSRLYPDGPVDKRMARSDPQALPTTGSSSSTARSTSNGVPSVAHDLGQIAQHCLPRHLASIRTCRWTARLSCGLIGGGFHLLLEVDLSLMLGRC